MGKKMSIFLLKEYAKPLPHCARCVIFPHTGWSIPGEGLMNIWAPLQWSSAARLALKMHNQL